MNATLFRVAMRLQRTGLIASAYIGVAYGAVQTFGFSAAAGSTPEQRLAFGKQMEVLGQQFSYLLPLPVRVDTIAGWAQWRVYGFLPVFLGFWALMSATGALRGDEEHGLVDSWLAAGVGRARYVLVRFLAFSAGAVIVVIAAAVGVAVGAVVSGSPLSLGPLALASLALASLALLAVTLTCYAVAAIAAQLASTRNAAAGVGGGVLLVLFFINGFSRSITGIRPLAQAISPFYQYDRSAPLPPGGTFDGVATGGMVVGAVVVVGLAALLVRRRDLGAPLLTRRARPMPATHEPAHSPLLRIPVLATLYEQRLALLTWSLATAVLAVFMASLGRSIVDVVSGPGGLRAYLTLVGAGNPYVAITGFFWFGIAQGLLAVFAITQVARWAGDDSNGRLEVVLSAPIARWRVVFDRALSLTIGTTLVICVSSLAFYAGAVVANIGLHGGDLLIASALLLPFGLSFAAAGAVLSARIPRATIVVLGALTLVSYLITQTAPLFRFPEWVTRLSVFSLYGTPLTSGVYWQGLWILLGISLGGFAAAMLLMQRRDVGR